MTADTSLWRRIARERTNEVSNIQRKYAALRVSRNGWRMMTLILALGYVAIWMNVYVFGGGL